MSRTIKQMMIDEMTHALGGASTFLVLDVSHLPAIPSNEFRSGLRAKKIALRVVKNSLARRVLAAQGLGPLGTLIEGPTALVWGSDGPDALAKEVLRWVKKHPQIVVRAGALDGSPLSPRQVDDLSKLPSRAELISGIIACFRSPWTTLAGQVGSPWARLASQIEQVAKKKSSEEAPASDPPPA